MRVLFVIMLAALLIAGVGCGGKDAPVGKGAQLIDGSYRLTRIYVLGQWTDVDANSNRDMVISGETMTTGHLYGEGEATEPIKTDSSKTPAEIDLMKNDSGKLVTEAYGIYKLEGDELTLAIGLDEGPESRPKDFTPRDNVMMFVMKRK
jgi:uncharacterized protein (TIGR03067 family)